MTLKLIRISRLKQLAKERGLEGPGQLGEAIGRKTNQTSDLLHGRASFGEKVARSIEHAAGLPSGWLDEAQTASELRAKPSAQVAHREGDELHVPLLAVSASMGPGIDSLHEEVIVGNLSLSPQWVSKAIPNMSKSQNLRFIHGYGDSMQPTFSDGDVLLVDAGATDVRADGIYVIEANDRLYIKRVRQRMDGSFEISSDNATVKTVDVLDGSQAVRVLGRVVWVWNGKKI